MQESVENLLSAGDGGQDADFVTRFHRCLGLVEKSDVFIVQKDVYETPDVILIVADALFQAWVGALKTLNQLTNRSAFRFNDFLIQGEFS